MAGSLIAVRRKGLKKARKLAKKVAIGSVRAQATRKRKKKTEFGFGMGL